MSLIEARGGILHRLVKPFQAWLERNRQKEIEKKRISFEKDRTLYEVAGIQEALEAVLAVKGFVRSTTEGKVLGANYGAPPVCTPRRFNPNHPQFFAVSRWNRIALSYSTFEYQPAEVWDEIKIIPDARNRTLGLYAGRDVILSEDQWSSREILEQQLKAARNYPARMATFTHDFLDKPSRNYGQPTWGGVYLPYLPLGI